MYFSIATRRKWLMLLTLLSALNLQAQNWIPVASMPNGSERYNAVSFSIAGKAYVTTGQTTAATLKTTFQYDPVADTWTPMADFAGGNRRVAAGFAIGTKGYVIGGRDDSTPTGVLHNDVWEFDPAANTWTQKANFPGGNRESMVAFSIDGYGYAGFGLNGSRKLDFYKYDPTADSWTQLPDINYYFHHYSTAVFVLNGKAYYATGSAYSSVTGTDYTSDKVFMFDPATGIWTPKNNFVGGARSYATAFTVNNKAYVGLGYTGAFLTDVWQYDEANDSWTQQADFNPGGRIYTSAFALSTKAYIGNGRSPSSQSLRNFFSWEPNLATHQNALEPFEVISAHNQIVVVSGQISDYRIQVYTTDGKVVLTCAIQADHSETTIGHQLQPGIYILTISDHQRKFTKKILVP